MVLTAKTNFDSRFPNIETKVRNLSKEWVGDFKLNKIDNLLANKIKDMRRVYNAKNNDWHWEQTNTIGKKQTGGWGEEKIRLAAESEKKKEKLKRK